MATIPSSWSNYTLATFNQTLINNPGFCTLQTCPYELDGKVLANTTYMPTLAGNALYTAIFGLLLTTQIFLGIHHRTWGYLYGMFGGLTLEVIGYGARLGMRTQMFTQNFFIMYLVCLTIGPAFLSASIYLCLSRIVTIYSAALARFKPQTYTYVFITSDVISLILQAAGGACASISTAGSSSQWAGIHTMVAGVAWQVVSLFIYGVLCLDFFLRVRMAESETFNPDPSFTKIRASRRFQFFLYGLILATLLIFTRSVFRCAELSGGFNGSLANQQITFMILEGCLIIMASTVLTVLHPGLVIGREAWQGASWDAEAKAAKAAKKAGRVVEGEKNRGLKSRLWKKKEGIVHSKPEELEQGFVESPPYSEVDLTQGGR